MSFVSYMTYITNTNHNYIYVVWARKILNMKKLIFKAYKEVNKTFSYNFSFPYIKMSTTYCQKTKTGFENRLAKGVKIFQKKKKTKSENTVMNGTEIFLKKKKTKIVNMLVNDIKINQKMKNKG